MYRNLSDQNATLWYYIAQGNLDHEEHCLNFCSTDSDKPFWVGQFSVSNAAMLQGD